MKEENNKQEKTLMEKVNQKVEDKIKALINTDIRQDNVDYLYKLVDIHKDLKNEGYWEMKEENLDMMYRGYDNYGAYDNYGGGRRRDSQGRYMESGRGNYGRRYYGDDMIDEMSEHYGTYMGEHESGRYNGPESSKSFNYMLKSAEDFFKHLKNEAGSQEEINMIKQTAKRISEM